MYVFGGVRFVYTHSYAYVCVCMRVHCILVLRNSLCVGTMIVPEHIFIHASVCVYLWVCMCVCMYVCVFVLAFLSLCYISLCSCVHNDTCIM